MEGIGTAVPACSAALVEPEPQASPSEIAEALLLQEALEDNPADSAPSSPVLAVLGFELIEPAVPAHVLREADEACAALKQLILQPPELNPNLSLPRARSLYAKGALLQESLRLGDGRLQLRVLLFLRGSLSAERFYAVVGARPAACKLWASHLRKLGRLDELRALCEGVGDGRELARVVVEQALLRCHQPLAPSSLSGYFENAAVSVSSG
jgi:hypothetical protein